MQRLTLNNGISMPRVGLGVWPLTDDQAYTAVTHALECGYRRIDTARVYDNEEGVGRAVRDTGIPRQDVFLTTKLWNADHGYDAALHAFDASIRRLGTDYIDLYLIHWPTPRRNAYVESYRALERIYAEGRAKAIGVSNFTAATLDRLLAETGIVPALNQIELHPYFPQRAMRTYAAERSMATEAWSPLAQGRKLLAEPLLARIAEEKGKSPAQVVLRWHLQLGNTVVPRSVTHSRIRENMGVFDFALSPRDLRDIATLDNGARIGPDPDTVNQW
ncbi:aldo/keto reductase [Streptomyces sp. NBC_01433]|uniref:aldo/keto reductase n=1 Tax=Streptomyces sp. NBC_01433 TaxID=2903864 RepID=UPI0022573D60|nr:aldo/keto reductase [Streptomyces sp. NBC_01433]MCX4681011.1 aldo/keto reductase [Streptomyces sp. NBC_01433]